MTPANLFAPICPDVVGVNHTGEFIRPYLPRVVGANHTGEFIRPYLPRVVMMVAPQATRP